MTFKKILHFLLIIGVWVGLSYSLHTGCLGLNAQETPAAGQDETASASYTIGANDLLTISVFEVPELTDIRVRVSAEGAITLPLLGEVKVGGLTTAGVEARLAQMLEASYLKKAQVTVFIAEYQSRKVSVTGAVVNPGTFDMLGKETLLQVVSRAGGLTDRASDRVVLIRENQSRAIDIDDLMLKATPEYNIPLQAGDIVNIPYERYIDIYIFGQVRRPGTLRLKRSGRTTLLKAIAQAGGFSTRARKGGVVVKRMVDGKETKLKVNINKILKGKKQSFVLQQDDIIFVPESLF